MANKEVYQALFTEAEALWVKIENLAQRELSEVVEGVGHEILMDISKGHKISWDGEIKHLADMLRYQGEVVGTLDVLRQPNKEE